jgi:hypothetical protein
MTHSFNRGIMRSLVKNKHLFCLIILLSTGNMAFCQTLTISGKLIDKDNSSIINNATIFLSPDNKTTTTNLTGEYSLTCTVGNKQISAKVLGYRTETIKFKAGSDSIINFYLEVLPFELNEVTVTDKLKKNIRITQEGNIIITPAAMSETPRLFSEPDLIKSLQLMPGVIAGRDGSSDLYVRGGGTGQNIILANGCYFFLPGHLLGIISSIDMDFLDNAELYKDYFPSELGSGAGSVISLQFKKPMSDSLHAQLRFGMLSSGFTIELPVKRMNLDITAGLKRGNYSVYAPLLKKLVSEEIIEFLPSDSYAFYDGFLNLGFTSKKLGKINYLFFGNYDNGKDENEITGKNEDTVIFNLDRISTGWKSMVHAFHWESPVKGSLTWKLDLNYNKLTMNREIFHQTEKRFNDRLFDVTETSYAFSPTGDIIGSALALSGEYENFSWSAGISDRIRYFTPNIVSDFISYEKVRRHTFDEISKVFEPAAFFSSAWHIPGMLLLDAGLRISGAFTKDGRFVIPEPRIRLSYNLNGTISPHVNYVRLSQLDHSVEGSNAGLKTMLWLPVTKDFGPEISDVISAGFQGRLNNSIIWTVDGYYKKIKGMVDFKSGASFVYDTTFSDLLDAVKGKAYGLEAGFIKRTGKLTGSLSYTYSRSKQEFWIPKGPIWIPSYADRPHNVSIALKYHLRTRTSFGMNWVFQSGAPATIYEQETSYGEFFDTKNNIRYFNYHRLDLSIRQIIYKRKFSVSITADVYNAYNHKNTYYFKKVYDWWEKKYYFKNISLFPIMPSFTVIIKY